MNNYWLETTGIVLKIHFIVLSPSDNGHFMYINALITLKYMFNMSLNIYGWPNANRSDSQAYRPNIFAYLCKD